MEILRNQNRRQVVVHELHHACTLKDAFQDAQQQTYRAAVSSSTPVAASATSSTTSPGSLLTIKKVFPESSSFWRLVDESEVEVLANVVCQDKVTFGYVVREVSKQGEGGECVTCSSCCFCYDLLFCCYLLFAHWKCTLAGSVDLEAVKTLGVPTELIKSLKVRYFYPYVTHVGISD